MAEAVAGLSPVGVGGHFANAVWRHITSIAAASFVAPAREAKDRLEG